MTLFTVHIGTRSGNYVIEYASLVECLEDAGLRAAFEVDAVTQVVVLTQDGSRATAVPEGLVTWERFRTSIIENSRLLLSGLGK